MLYLLCLVSLGCHKNAKRTWVQEDGYQWAQLDKEISLFDESGFTRQTPKQTGIDFANRVTREHIRQNRVLSNGSGVATGDVDGDGLTDIYFCRIDGPNVLYRNLGNWEFEDITHQAGVQVSDKYSSGAALADIDGDKDLDIIVTTIGGGNKLFINDGTGTFTEKENALPADKRYGSHSIAVADIDRDGDPDLYITNYKVRSAKDIYPYERRFEHIIEREGSDYSVLPKFSEHYTLKEEEEYILWWELGEPDLLYINNGDGSFKNVSLTSGIFKDTTGNPVDKYKDWGLHAKFSDVNNDLYPDLYVANDFESPDRIWINNKDGTFREIESTAIRSISLSSMSVDFGDIDNDGHIDIFTAEMLARERAERLRHVGTMLTLPEPVGVTGNRPQYTGNALQLNRGDATFANITDYAGVRSSGWSWSAVFSDIDLDGYEDILITTGNYYDSQNLDATVRIQSQIASGELDPADVMLSYPALKQQNVIFKNNMDGTFSDQSSGWGFSEKDISQGLAMADLDNDGDLDMVINRLNETAGIYENRSTANRIAVMLVGETGNTEAIGSKIKVENGSLIQTREVSGGGSYLSSSQAISAFAAPSGSIKISITWYDGTVSIFTGLKKNRAYKFFKSRLSPEQMVTKDEKDSITLFIDKSELLNHTHHEEFYDDFGRKQSLLPYRLSQPGPAISWIDIDKDGYDDLMIGSGKSEPLKVYKNRGGERFSYFKEVPEIGSSLNDISSILFLPSGNGSVWAGIYNYEGVQPRSHIFYYRMSDPPSSGYPKVDSLLLPGTAAIGPVISADYDRDGDLDLFIGTKVIPGMFPAPATSRLYKNTGAGFEPDTENELNEIGMVNGAAFSDINGDGWPDLLLAREWNSPAVLINKEGKFTNKTEQWGMETYRGLWNGITTGDLNNDGKLDIIATNIGKNIAYNLHTGESKKDVRIYYAESGGTTRIIESIYSDELEGWVPLKKVTELINEFPLIGRRIRSHKQYSQLTLEEMLGVKLDNFKRVSANTFSSMIFLNRGDHFEPRKLPFEAQLTTAFYAGVSDFNTDGNEDLLLSQNFFARPVGTPRSDAGRGLILLGEGNGDLIAMAGQSSGVKIYGEQRGAAISDYNLDGRADIVITQNGSETKLYQNSTQKQGLVVKLKGDKSNPKGIGAKLWVIYVNDDKGPVREIKAGSGYFSQNSPVQVLGYKEYPKAIQVIWPDGRQEVVELPDGLLMIEIDKEGNIVNQQAL